MDRRRSPLIGVKPKPIVVLVDSDKDFSDAFKTKVELLGYSVLCILNVWDAIRFLLETQYEDTIYFVSSVVHEQVDESLPADMAAFQGFTAFQLMRFITDRHLFPALVVALTSGLDPEKDEADEALAQDSGALRGLPKFSLSQGEYCLGKLLESTLRRGEQLLANEFSARYDNLTRVYDREGGKKRWKRTCLEARSRKHPLAFIFLDVNGLGELNNRYGHKQGDALLQSFVEMLKSGVRPQDYLIRLGGDEFLIVLVNANEVIAKKVLGRLHKRAKTTPHTIKRGKSSKEVPITFTGAVSAISHEEIEQNADVVLEAMLEKANMKERKRKRKAKLERSRRAIPTALVLRTKPRLIDHVVRFGDEEFFFVLPRSRKVDFKRTIKRLHRAVRSVSFGEIRRASMTDQKRKVSQKRTHSQARVCH